MDSPFQDETRVYVKSGGHYVLVPEEHAPVMKAWKSGAAFVDAQGRDGDLVAIKLGEVEAVLFMPADTQERASKHHKALKAWADQEWTP
jgi:hypothetical protein